MNREGKEVIAAIIGGIALIVAALITGFFSSAPTRMSIEATQTAEASNLPVIAFTPTIPLLITPTPQTSSNLQPTPINTPITQISPLSTIPFRKNELFLAVTGAILVFGFIGISLYLPAHNSYQSMAAIPRVMASAALISPFVLVWTSFFFSFPQDIPLALVLFVALLDLAIFLWFPEFFAGKLNLLLSILLLITPVYITAFGFTNMTISKAFFVASLISGIEILYVFGLVILEERKYKKNR